MKAKTDGQRGDTGQKHVDVCVWILLGPARRGGRLPVRILCVVNPLNIAGGVVVFFSSDQNIVFPFRPKNIYPLPMKSADDNTTVNSEKIKALKRVLLPDPHD